MLAVLALAGCAGGGGRYRGPALKPVANPSAVIATELAFARAAQEDGQWKAFRDFAVEGALIFGVNGAFLADPWLKAQAEPNEAMRWRPLQVWSSCDGSLAVTRVSFVDPSEGKSGLGYTVWKRSGSGDYRWEFDFGFPSGEPIEKPEMIASETATCADKGASRPIPVPVSTGGQVVTSNDGTLAYAFHFFGDGVRNFDLWLTREDSYDQVVEVNVDRPQTKSTPQ